MKTKLPLLPTSLFNQFTILLIWSLLYLPLHISAQELPLKDKASEELTELSVEVYSFFDSQEKRLNKYVAEYTNKATILSLNREITKDFLHKRPSKVKLKIPYLIDGKELELDLVETKGFSIAFPVYLSSDKSTPYDYRPGLHYTGRIKNLPEAKVGISIFDDEIFGLIRTNDGNIIIGKLMEGDLKGGHIVYNDKDLLMPQEFICNTKDDNKPYTYEEMNHSQKDVGDCVAVYLEVGRSVVTARGGVNQALNFVTASFHQNVLIYNSENVSMSISEILIWNTPDPYEGSSDTDEYLDRFQAETAAINGDIGHLLVMDDIGGLAAGFNALCNANVNNKLCMSGLVNNFNLFPNFSHTVFIMAHEMGHLLGSRHTHACVWNGTNTQIDDCGNVWADNQVPPVQPEGNSCYNDNSPILPTNGTIMSYCSVVAGSSVNFTFGFGPQPGNVIRNSIAGASCLNASCSTPLNDLCADAWTLQCGTTLYGNIDSASDNDAPSGCPGGGVPDEGVWFTFTGNGQVYTVSTADSDFNTQINIYSGSCGSLTCIGGDNESGPGTTSSFTFCSVNGIQYWVYLDGFAGATGDYTINLNCVNDFVAPDITCPSNVSVGNDPGECGAFVIYPAAMASDNCGVQSIDYSQNPNTFFPVGTTPVTATAMDINGNTANCFFNVTVSDLEAPTIMCSDGSVVFNGEDEHILDPDDYTIYDDNCGIQSVILDPPFITCEDLGETLIITATATDIYGNTADCNFNLEVLGLPCGWSFTPDGINCTDGNDVTYSVPLEEFYVESTNCHFGHPFNTDVMAFAQYELCGNGSITAHVTDISGNALGWAGVSMRENNDAGSKKVQLLTNRSNLSRREVRTVTNGNSIPQQFMSFNRYWLRLTRNGNQFVGHVSPNGSTWYMAMASNVSMANCIEIGLVVTNYNSNSTVTGTFANVTVDEAMPKPVSPWDEVQLPAYKNASISVFPNPTTNGELFIDVSGFHQEQLDIITIDPLGRIINNKQINTVQDDLEVLSLRGHAPGFYYLKFIGKDGVIQVQKIIYSGN